jgi:Putative addiction module component
MDYDRSMTAVAEIESAIEKLSPEWDEEIERRAGEIESGVEKGIPAAQVMKEARRALDEARRLSSARRK